MNEKVVYFNKGKVNRTNTKVKARKTIQAQQ